MDAKGIATVKLTIAKEQYEGRFFVTPLGSQVVLGTRFMKDYETRITIGKTSSMYI